MRQQVQVDNTRLQPLAPDSTKLHFDRMQAAKQPIGWPIRINYSDGINKPRLIRQWHRRGPIKPGLSNNPYFTRFKRFQNRRQCRHRRAKFRVRQIGPQTDKFHPSIPFMRI